MCDAVEKVELVLQCIKDKEHPVKTIVVMQTPSTDLVSRGQQAGIHILSLKEMEVSRSSLIKSPMVVVLDSRPLSKELGLDQTRNLLTLVRL